jgi:hypothetical protein
MARPANLKAASHRLPSADALLFRYNEPVRNIPIAALDLRTLVGFQVHYGLTESLAPNFLSPTLRSTIVAEPMASEKPANSHTGIR